LQNPLTLSIHHFNLEPLTNQPFSTHHPMRKLKLDELNRATVEEFQQQDKLPVVVVLDNVRSMHNIGSIFRTSDALAATSGLPLRHYGPAPAPRNRKNSFRCHAIRHLDYFETPLEAVAKLRADGYKIIAIEQAENSIMLNDFYPRC
jgi:23S rRNA (guanosine2251-2'-O)-methyltransferase